MSVSRSHGTTSKTFVDSQPELQDNKSHKRKRKHREGVVHSQKHCKYPKVECDDDTALKTSLQEEHHNKCSSEKHSSSEKFPKQLISDTLPDEQSNVNGQERKHKKKKKKKKKRKLCASASDVISSSVDGGMSVSHSCESTFSTSKTFVDSLQKEHRNKCSSEKHSSDEKFPKQLLSDTLPVVQSNVNGQEQKHKKKKKRKFCASASDVISSSVDGGMSVSHGCELTFSTPKTFVDSLQKEHRNKCSSEKHSSDEKFPKQLLSDTLPVVQSNVNGQEQKHKRKKKKKRKLDASASDVISSSVDGGMTVSHGGESTLRTSKTFVDSLQKDHRSKCSSVKHGSDETFPKQLLSDTLSVVQSSVNGQEQKHKKKKKKKLYASTSDSHGTPYNADYRHLHKYKKKKRPKKTRCKEEDVVPHSNLSKDSSSHLLVSSANVVCGNEILSTDAEMNTNEDSQAVLVSQFEDISPDEIKYVESVYNEHKSSKSKHRQRKVNTDVETEIADIFPIVLSKASPNVCCEISSNTEIEKSTTEQCLNAADVLKLLHAENSLYPLRDKSAVKEAGEKLEV